MTDQPNIDWPALTGALLLINPKQRLDDTDGDQGLIEADVHVLDGPHTGDTHENVAILNPALRDQLARNVGNRGFNLGRLNTSGELDKSTLEDRALALPISQRIRSDD